MRDTCTSHFELKKWLGGQGGLREGQNMAQNAPRGKNSKQNCWLRIRPEPLQMGRAPLKLTQTYHGQLGGPFGVHFEGSLTHLGASWGLGSQQLCMWFVAEGSFWAIFWPSLTPQLPKSNINHQYNTQVTARYHCFTFPTIWFLIGRIIWPKNVKLIFT